MTSTYIKALVLVALLALLNACEDDSIESSNCDSLVELSAEKYQNGSSAFFSIISASITGDCLEVEYSSSGCDGKNWSEEMVDAEEVLESFPIQRKLKMLLKNEEACAAVFTKTVSFDLTPMQTENYSEVIINLDGYAQPLLYQYGNDSIFEIQIQKKWDLVNINGGLAGIDIDFPPGSITWDFDESNVKIINNNPYMNAIYDGLSSGTYDYLINEINGYKTLEVDEQDLGGTYILNDELIVDQRAVDGFQMQFEKHIDDDKINGKWNLIDVTCECEPVDFRVGDHIWQFDINNNALEVDNKIDQNLQILETGSYDVAISEAVITILSVEYSYHFEDGSLFLGDHPEADGPLLKFVRD